MNEIVYVVLACDSSGESWIVSICRDNLIAEEACAKLNSESVYEHVIEEHEIYG